MLVLLHLELGKWAIKTYTSKAHVYFIYLHRRREFLKSVHIIKGLGKIFLFKQATDTKSRKTNHKLFGSQKHAHILHPSWKIESWGRRMPYFVAKCLPFVFWVKQIRSKRYFVYFLSVFAEYMLQNSNCNGLLSILGRLNAIFSFQLGFFQSISTL